MPDLSHVNVVAGVSRFTREVTGADVFRGAGREGEAAGAADTIKVLTTRNKQRLGMTILLLFRGSVFIYIQLLL